MIRFVFILFFTNTLLIFISVAQNSVCNLSLLSKYSTKVEGYPKDTIWYKTERVLKDHFVLNNIFFQLGVAELLSYDDTIRGFINPKHIYIQLDSLAEAISNDGGTFEIQNHIDCRVSDRCCYRLSDARAETVMQYLISKGVSEEKLSFKGYEGDVPRIYFGKSLTCDYIIGLDSLEEKEKMHQLNRRVTITRKSKTPH
jgi:hypothetical protein